MKSLIAILVFVLTTHDISALGSNNTYRKLIIDGSSWPQMIYKSVARDINSRIECGLHCDLDPNACTLFTVFNNKCYLGKPGFAFSHISAQPNQADVYTSTLLLESPPMDFFKKVDNVTEGNWTMNVYKALDNMESNENCSVECLIYESATCDMFVLRNGVCYLGTGLLLTGPDPAITAPLPGAADAPWDVYILTSYLDEMDTSDPFKREVMPQVDSEDWSKYVYDTKNGTAESEEECFVHCYYQEQCHFWYYDVANATCYFGSYDTINSSITLITNLTNTISVLYKRLPLNETVSNDNTTFEAWRTTDFIYKQVPVTYFDDPEVCSQMCLLDPDCDFVFSNTTGCFLGDFDTTEPLPRMRLGAAAQPVYFMKDRAFSNNDVLLAGDPDRFFQVPNVHSRYWAHYVKHEYMNETQDECAFRMLLDKSWAYDFFVYTGGICYLVVLSTWHSTVPASLVPLDQLNTAYWEKELDSLQYIDRFDVGPDASAYTHNIYKNVTLNNTLHNATTSYEECMVNCYLDTELCHGYIHQPPFCYLLNYNVNTTFVTLTSGTVHFKRPFAGVVVGGIDYANISQPTVSVIKDGHFGQDCEYPGRRGSLPDPDGLLTSYATPLVYLQDRYLLMAGGLDAVTSTTVDTSIKLDLKEQGIRSWITTLGGLNEKRAFHQIVRGFNPGDGKALAIGGVNETGECTDSIEEYDPVYDNWTMTNLKLFTPRQKFCALNDEVNRKIYIVGGSKCNSSEFNSTLYENVTYNVFPTVPILTTEIIDYAGASPVVLETNDLNFGREFPYCGLVSDETSREPTYLVVAGGILENGQVANTSERFTLDGTTAVTFDIHTEMKCRPIYPAASSSMLILDESADDRDIYLIGWYDEQNAQKLTWYEYNSGGWEVRSMNTPVRNHPGQAEVPLEELWHCKLPTGDWILIVQSNFSVGAAEFTGDTDLDADLPEKYVDLVDLQQWKSCDDRYHFKLVWPELPYYNEWWQSNDPRSPGNVTDFMPVSIGYEKNFQGLEFRGSAFTQGATALMGGNIPLAANYSDGYLVGQFTMPGAGLAGPFLDADTADPLTAVPVQEVKLYVKVDC